MREPRNSDSWLGGLYGGAAILVGTGAERPAELAAELDPEGVLPGDVRFLQVLSRWQLGVPAVNRDPLDRWCGEPVYYELASPERGTLRLHPSRVVRFIGNAFPDPGFGPWSDSVLQVLYDASSRSEEAVQRLEATVTQTRSESTLAGSRLPKAMFQEILFQTGFFSQRVLTVQPRGRRNMWETGPHLLTILPLTCPFRLKPPLTRSPSRGKYNGVRWITNSPEFVTEYTDRFQKAGVRKFTFMLIPAVKGSR